MGDASLTLEMADIAPPPRVRWRKGTRKGGRLTGCISVPAPPEKVEENEVAT